jgi:hypothetical protein
MSYIYQPVHMLDKDIRSLISCQSIHQNPLKGLDVLQPVIFFLYNFNKILTPMNSYVPKILSSGISS